ncbi:hypothetical protein [Novosphingobium sp. YAF33]|uniref:hypothetical protein n=1 Tax=Novosphingobium sp. YAF33 TaxID=3233082 RepID=UPI003F99ED91
MSIEDGGSPSSISRRFLSEQATPHLLFTLSHLLLTLSLDLFTLPLDRARDCA